MNLFFVILLVLITLLVGIFIGKMIFTISSTAEKKVLEEKNNSLRNEYEILKQFSAQQKNDLQKQIEQLNSEKINLTKEKQVLIAKLSEKETQNNNLKQKNEEQKQEVEQLQAKFTKEFENLANKILEEKSIKFTQQNKENIGNILNPLQEKIQLFEKKVEESKLKNVEIHTSLKEQLKHLQEQNIKISQEAENLTKALKSDTKTQGNWGELILEQVLEKSGLERDREYFVQQVFDDPNNEGKKIKPDVIVHLPNKKKIIVDSKVSLTHYERFVSEEDKVLKERYLKEHLNSVKKHIEELSEKKYQDIYKIESPDFVLLFIPIEPAFAVAMNFDNTLYDKAFGKNIVLVTPTTLLATLKTIDSLWSIEKRQKNVEEIAKLAGTLFDKFVSFAENLKNIRERSIRLHNEYEEAEKKLLTGRENMVRTIEKIKNMGAKTQKLIPEYLLKKEKGINDDSLDLIS